MLRWFGDVDRILRGDATRLSALRRGSIEAPAGGLAAVIALLGLAYGACMGSYALLWPSGPSVLQMLATTVKVPALFFLTLAVTFPSLYVFNALVGSRLSLASAFRLLIAAMAVMLAVLASLGPIVAFFSVSTTSHAFMLLLNVLIFGISGSLGLVFLLRTLHRLSVARTDGVGLSPSEGTEPVGPDKSEAPGALERLDDQVLGRHVRTVFRIWVIVFGLVGAQMSWVLSPFLGSPGREFVWFHGRESNFFQAVWYAAQQLLH